MPRWRSISMKSEVAPFLILLLLTAPATWMAPPKRSSFSVRVVLPASGCAMTAKVRRRVISSCKVMRSLSCRCCGGAVVSRRTVVAAFRVSRFSPGRLPVRFSGSLSGHFPAVLGANLPAVSGYLFRFLRFLWSFSVLPGLPGSPSSGPISRPDARPSLSSRMVRAGRLRVRNVLPGKRLPGNALTAPEGRREGLFMPPLPRLRSVRPPGLRPSGSPCCSGSPPTP